MFLTFSVSSTITDDTEETEKYENKKTHTEI